MKNATLIALIVDRSGSIRDCLVQMQAAVTEFISAQKQVPGECELVLVDFDTIYREVYRGPIADAPYYQIEPRGNTALHDAVGFTIDSVGKDLAAREEADRPDKVMFVVVTDGEENASKQFIGPELTEEQRKEFNETRRSVATMIAHQTEKYNWNFDFLGANQDAILTAQTLNILAANAMSFCTSHAGTRSISASLNTKAAMYRSSGHYKSYDATERAAAMQGDDVAIDPVVTNAQVDDLLNKAVAAKKGRAARK